MTEKIKQAREDLLRVIHEQIINEGSGIGSDPCEIEAAVSNFEAVVVNESLLRRWTNA